jgi:hypothetical protein
MELPRRDVMPHPGGCAGSAPDAQITSAEALVVHVSARPARIGADAGLPRRGRSHRPPRPASLILGRDYDGGPQLINALVPRRDADSKINGPGQWDGVERRQVDLRPRAGLDAATT